LPACNELLLKGRANAKGFTTTTKPATDGALISIQVGPSTYPHTLALLFHSLPAFLQAALVKGCGGVT